MSTDREDTARHTGSTTVAVNGALAATQVVFTSLGYLLAYRVIGGSVGIEVIGAWTLCLALGSISAVSDVGVSDGLVRAIAQHSAGPRTAAVRQILVTGLVFCLMGCTVGAALCYAVLDNLLPLLLTETPARATARALLLPAIVVALLNTLSTSCVGVLAGLERYGLRLVTGLTATLVFIGMVFVFVPRVGVDGVVWAYLAQTCTALIVSLVLCLHVTRSSEAASNRPSWIVARELVKVGLPMRATGLVTFALDPLTRVAAAFYGGALAAGHYEVASRFIMQLRALIVAGFQAGLPRLVKLSAIEHPTTSRIETELFRGGVLIAVAAFTIAALLSPLIYEFILGQVPRMAMTFFMLLCGGWCINSISAPFYFSLVSKRRVGTIWMSSGLMALINVPLCWALGSQFGAVGVVAALAIAVGSGSLVTIVARLRADGLTARVLRLPELILAGASIVALAVCFSPSFGYPQHIASFALLILVTIAYVVVFALVSYRSGIFRR